MTLRNTRFVFIITALLILAALLCSCDSGADPLPPDSTGTDTASESAPPSAALEIISGKVCSYTVIRDEDASKPATAAAVSVRKAIAELTGIMPEITTDYKKASDSYNPGTLAILVGMTGYDESAEVAGEIGYGEYSIRVCGNKLVLAAALDSTITAAAERFCADLSGFWNGNDLTIPADYARREVVDPESNAVPVCGSGYFKGMYDTGNDSVMFTIGASSPEDYTAYVTSVTADGFTVYAENEINDNLFTTCTSSETILNILYLAPHKEIRIIADRAGATAMPAREQDNKYTASTVSSVTQVGCEFAYGGQTIADKQIGMCYIFRLADGSFIIEDGGFNNKNDADRIYSQLVKLNGGPSNIVIAAWIFSHTHGDHVGAFYQFSDYYSSKVKIETFILNTPSRTQYIEAAYDTDSAAQTLLVKTRRFAGSTVSVAHPGQVYHIRNAELTVLYTYELLTPKPLTVFNSSSLAIRIMLEGQSFMMLGDLYNDGNIELATLYGKTLKSDFLQAAHHGATGGVHETYVLMDPTVVFWPLGEYDYFGVGKWNRSTETYNRYFFESKNVREIILAGSSVRTLSLPYTFPAERILPKKSS